MKHDSSRNSFYPSLSEKILNLPYNCTIFCYDLKDILSVIFYTLHTPFFHSLESTHKHNLSYSLAAVSAISVINTPSNKLHRLYSDIVGRVIKQEPGYYIYAKRRFSSMDKESIIEELKNYFGLSNLLEDSYASSGFDYD